MIILFNNITLGNNSRTRPVSGYKVAMARSVQIGQFVRARKVKTWDRGNMATRVSFNVDRGGFRTAAEAESVLHDEFASLEGEHTLQVILGDGSFTSIRYLHNAVLEAADYGVIGISTPISYRFVGGLYTTSPTPD